ncbi:hypothetical protein KIW84_032645 [Lathyrus oleraceus]|uniref:Uncharacterized protein n=1 Tax=Pisum sativum TaxID=3888 RepID=A0A9D4XZ42_PEA|nr:hypothetical protein KIW84_032645 [Pisum sativum]
MIVATYSGLPSESIRTTFSLWVSRLSSLVCGVEIMIETSSPNNGVVEENPPKKSLISFAFQGAPVIITAKLNVCNLATIQMNDQDLLEYLTRAHSTIDSLKLMLALTNTTISTIEELIDRFIRVSLPSDDTYTTPESSAFVSKFSNGGCGCGRGRGRGGRSNFFCIHCRKDAHTEDRCFDLHGYPNKIANVSQIIANYESKGEPKTNFSTEEYQEYL